MSTPLRVLIVENRENNALEMLNELRCTGYEPAAHRVETREALLAEVKQNEWDVVLVDSSIPQFSTAEAIQAAREIDSDLPFVIVAGAIGEEAAVSAMKAGAYDYVREHNLSQLTSVVDRALRDVEVQRERKKAQERLRERDALFRSVLENVSDLIVIVDRDRVIRYHSPSVSRVLGYEPDELIGTPGLDYLHPDERSAAVEALTHPEQSLR